MSDEVRDWRISEALDKLCPVFRVENLTTEEIEAKATLFGMPHYGMWAAHHLYETVKEHERI